MLSSKGKPTEGKRFLNAYAFAMLCKWGPGSLSWGVNSIWGRTGVRGRGHRLRSPGATWRCVSECQAQPLGPRGSRLSPAVLYQYQGSRGDEQAYTGIILQSAVSKGKPILESTAAKAERPQLLCVGQRQNSESWHFPCFLCLN